jgi:hypothetical protein
VIIEITGQSTSDRWKITDNGKSPSITQLQEEATQIDHIKDGNKAGTGRKA